MPRLQYTGANERVLKYMEHGQDITLVMKPGELYVLPGDNGEVKYLQGIKALVVASSRPSPKEKVVVSDSVVGNVVNEPKVEVIDEPVTISDSVVVNEVPVYRRVVGLPVNNTK